MEIYKVMVTRVQGGQYESFFNFFMDLNSTKCTSDDLLFCPNITFVIDFYNVLNLIDLKAF